MYKDINKFTKRYQPKANRVKVERGDLLADPHKILSGWKNCFCQLLNIDRVGGARQNEVYKAKIFVLGSSACEVEVAIRNLKRYKSLGVDQIQAKKIHKERKYCVRRYINFLS
jgi:hypothetical protein